MIGWRWKVATALLALVVMGLVVLWPDAGYASHQQWETRMFEPEPSSGLVMGDAAAWGVRFTVNTNGFIKSLRVVASSGKGANQCQVSLTSTGAIQGLAFTRPSITSGTPEFYTFTYAGSGGLAVSAGTTYTAWCQVNPNAGGNAGIVLGAFSEFTTADGHLTFHDGREDAVWDNNMPTTAYTANRYAVDPIFVTTLSTPTPVPENQVISDSTTILQDNPVAWYPATARGNVVRVVNSGSITHMRIGRSPLMNTTVQWAIYPFGSTAPLAQGTATGLAEGWNTIDIPDVAISAGFYVPTILQADADQVAYITAMTCPSGQGNNTGSTQIYYAGPCARFRQSASLTYPTEVEGGNLMYAVDMRVNAPASSSATATPWATSTPFPAAGTATPAATVTQFNNPDLVGAVNRLGDILQRVGDQITAAILVHGVVQAMTTMLDKLNDLIYQLTQIPLLLAASMSNVLALPSPEYFDTHNAELDVLIDAKTGGLGGIIEHLDFVDDLLEPECVGWTGVEFTLPNPRPGQAAMAFAFPPGNLWDNIYCPYIRPWLSLSLNFVFLFVAWRNGLKIFRLKG